jgi:hypothetical protein
VQIAEINVVILPDFLVFHAPASERDARALVRGSLKLGSEHPEKTSPAAMVQVP